VKNQSYAAGTEEKFQFSDPDELKEAVQDRWLARGGRPDPVIEIDGDNFILIRGDQKESIRIAKVTSNQIWFTDSNYDLLEFHHLKDMMRIFYNPPGMKSTTLVDYFDRDGN
jgi:hypothetical protein